MHTWIAKAKQNSREYSAQNSSTKKEEDASMIHSQRPFRCRFDSSFGESKIKRKEMLA
jgi:hypothetical protein